MSAFPLVSLLSAPGRALARLGSKAVFELRLTHNGCVDVNLNGDVTLNGVAWRGLGEYPRPVAESFRRALDRHGVPSMLRTPYQWVSLTPVIELEAGAYWGQVHLFVPTAALERAEQVLSDLLRQDVEAPPEDSEPA